MGGGEREKGSPEREGNGRAAFPAEQQGKHHGERRKNTAGFYNALTIKWEKVYKLRFTNCYTNNVLIIKI